MRGRDLNGDASLGESGSIVSWRVQGPHSLQRIGEGKQFIVIMKFDVGDNKNCTVGVKYLLQKGKTDVIERRDDNGEDARFTLSRVISASCSIE